MSRDRTLSWRGGCTRMMTTRVGIKKNMPAAVAPAASFHSKASPLGGQNAVQGLSCDKARDSTARIATTGTDEDRRRAVWGAPIYKYSSSTGTTFPNRSILHGPLEGPDAVP